jgi:hypothetical protein
MHCATELRHAITGFGGGGVHAEDAGFVAVECDRPAVATQVLGRGCEVAERRFRSGEVELHQAPSRVVDEHEQRASLATSLEPLVVAAVDLNQLTEALVPVSRRLWTAPPLHLRSPESRFAHPLA